MALQKPSPGLLPAENYTRFGLAFNAIDLLAGQLPFAQQAIEALLTASASHGTALTTLQQQGLSASQAIAALLDANSGYAQALTELQANDGAFDVLIGALENLTDAQGKAITAEQSRAATAEALARIIAAPKYSVPLDTITLPNGGAVYWNGSTSTGPTETSGGLRVPQGQTGIFSQHRTRFQPTAAQRTKLAGRPVQFMVAFRSTVGALTALRDSAGFSTLGGVIEGVPSIVGVKIYSIRPDLWLAVGDAVLTGNENVITIALQVSGNTLPVAADVSFVAIGAMFMPVDATGTSDVLADFVQPLALRADNLIAAARIRYAPLLGAGPGVTDRALVIPAGQSGAGSLAIYGAPVAGLQAGTRVRCRFAIQVAGGAFVSTGVAQSDPPVTLIELFGATVEMTDGSQVGAVAGLTPTSPTTYEATVTFTATGAERIAEFYLKVDENSAVRLTEGQIRLGLMFVDVLSTDPTTTVAAQTARLTESFRAFIAAAPDRFRDWCSASSLSDGDYGTIREAVAAMRTGGSQDQPNRVVVLPGTYTNECATGVSINPADYIEIVGKGARRDVEIIARLPDNQAAQDSQQPLYIQRSCRVAGLTVRGRNVKYPAHLEAGNAPVAAIWDINDCDFVHEGATGWTETSALGVGQNDGSKLTATGSTFLSPTSGAGLHNNTAWARGALATFTGCSLIGTGDSATSLAVTSQGAGVMSTVNLRGCVLSGRVHHYVSFLPGTPLSAYRGAPWEYTVRITDSDPVDWLSPCPFDVLTLTSVAAGNSAAAVGNTGAVRLFGRRPDVRPGAADYAARLHSSHLVSVPEGQFDPGVSLGARLGDMRGAAARPLDIFWDGNATAVTIALDQNYAGMTNVQVLASLNGNLSAAMGGNTGGRAFSLSQPYHNRAPIRQPDREATAVNAGTATILKGHVLAKVGRRVRLMTSTDAASAFAGIALDDAVPGRSVRFLKTGLIGQAHLLFDGDQTFTTGARYQISASNPGRLMLGTDLPVLSVRSVETYGAALEIIGTVAFTGSATEAVRDAFAAITYRDVPGLPAVVDTLASKGANSDITSLTGLTNTFKFGLLNYVDVTLFGANGTPGDGARVQAAIDAAFAAGIPTVLAPRLPNGIPYVMDSAGPVINPGVNLVGRGDPVFQRVGALSMFQAGSVPSITSQTNGNAQLASDVKSGAMALALVPGQAAQFAVGDFLVLTHDAYFYNPSQPRAAEFVRVQNISGDTIILCGPLSYFYKVANAARLIKPTMTAGVGFESIEIRMDRTAAVDPAGVTNARGAIDLRFCLVPLMRHVTVRDNAYAAFFMHGCYKAMIESPKVYDLGSATNDSTGAAETGTGLGGYGYAVHERGLNEGLVVRGAHVERCRHGYTSGIGFPDIFKYGMPRGTTISDSVHIDAKASGWDTHESGDGITFLNCKTLGGQHHGFQVRAHRTKLIGCLVQDVIGCAAYLPGGNSSPGFAGDEVEIRNFASDNTNLGIAFDGADYRENGAIRDQGVNNIVDGAKITRCGGPALSTNTRTRDGTYRNIRAIDPCLLTTTSPQAFVFNQTADDATSVENALVQSPSGKVVNLVAVNNSAHNPFLDNIRGVGHTGADFTGQGGANRVLTGGAGGKIRGVGARVGMTIAGNAISIKNIKGSLIELIPSSGTTDTLTTISDGQEGDVISLTQAVATHTITFAASGVNRLKGQASVSLAGTANGPQPIITLLMRAGAWYELHRNF